MGIAAQVGRLKLSQLMVLCRAFIGQPLFIIPTLNATRKTIQICDALFGHEHHKHNKANAFRHALWNFLICQKCYRVSKSAERAINWSKKITQLHEELAPNSELAKRMDLHNNYIGRKLFKDHLSGRIEIVDLLKNKLKDAVQIKNIEEIERAQKKLVFIED